MDDDIEDPGPYNPRNNKGRNAQRGGRLRHEGNEHGRRPGANQLAFRGPRLNNRPAQGNMDPRPGANQLAFRGPRQNNRPAQVAGAPQRFSRDNTPVRGNGRSSNDNQERNFPKKNFLGFKRLEEIAKSETKETLNKLMENKEAFIELIQSPVEKYDLFVVIMEIIAKVCQSSFDGMRSRMLSDICNSNFIVSFKSYLMELPYEQTKLSNNLYWKDNDSQLAFWINFVDFCECIVNTSPTLALNKCRSLLEATSKACLDGLRDRHSFKLPEEYANKLEELRERMGDFEKRSSESQPSKRFRFEEGSPPENFRELSLMPTREDLLHQRPFVRPNIVDGGYQDVEHYLDVQFRLLREDCFGPLRDGLNQFLRDQTKKRYDNIRVIRDVKFLRPYASQTKVGSLVQIDVRHNKMFKRTNWSNNKRFIFGSLVLFTKDNCKTFIAATILDREEEYLLQGMIPVSIMGQGFDIQLYNDDVYTMIESEVYYEPYYHVLKVLQDPSFPQHLAMKQYIVHVNPQPQPPSYLMEDTAFTIETLDTNKVIPDFEDLHLMDMNDDTSKGEVKFIVRDDKTWPKKDALSFNESQYDAYKLALTHEFAVIQGPPGTGKTYLGIKVAKTLFENLKSTSECLMLVICYTNHALDQFLEALLDVTDSIVRIGGQSRNEAMEQINLNKLRHQVSIHGRAHKAFFEQKISLKESTSSFHKALVKLDVLLNGVVKSDFIKDDVNEVKLLCDFYGEALRGRDPLYYWLFEHNAQFNNDIGYLLEENAGQNDFANHEKENRKRTGMVLDEQEKFNAMNIEYRNEISSFSMDTATSQMKTLVAEYWKTQNDPIKQNILAQLQFLESYKTMFNEMSAHRNRRIALRVTAYTNFSRISTIDRWSLYFGWVQKKTRDAKAKVGGLLDEVNNVSTMYEEARMMMDMLVLKDRKIVGMTTSGAARLRKLLQALNPPIVIVEEAAEVLEQHIITSLTEGCKHLILIGDHQQLRPSASHMKLAKHFDIEVSLFERMINNGIHSRRLSVQHRMRPEIAALICPHIYPELENHPSVHEFPDVKGITKNLYFFNHDFKEETVQENMSRTNHREADLTLALANYLMQQGYSTEDITILSAYKGQMFYMRKESDNYSHLKGVKITVVDNYQGEESKIILLSLVRNNDENKIGFLGTANRVCVALSRAKHGFYIFGNIETLKVNSDLWKHIASTLECNKSLGSEIVLQCQSHTTNMTIIEKLEDFKDVPEGGCLLPCEKKLRCGHQCLLMCHGYDRRHNTAATKCTRKCERILCVLEHVCPKRCADDCGLCKQKVVKELPCGHMMQVFCHLEPEDPAIKCQTMVEVTLPDCKHKANKLCPVNIKNVICLINCEYRVEKCGHSCLRKCHVNADPNHEKYLCMKQCANAKLNCKADLEGDRGDHQCRKKCHETCDNCDVRVMKQRSTCKHKITTACSVDPDTVPCMKKCARSLPCKHFCKKLCKDPCGDCSEMVVKTIPDCNHNVKMMCKFEPARKYCERNCERKLECGHKCKGLCADECDASKCIEPSLRKLQSPCGHLVTLPCNMAKVPTDEVEKEQLLSWCKSDCGAELACKHICGGKCAYCRQGRLHQACRQTCNQINICQHQCEEPCNQICPPCKKPCEIKCQHSQCNQLCGAPCKSCKEQCGRRCPHGACENRCGEECSIPACDEACDLQLACGHACRGLCGQPCPPVCRLCSPDTFPVDFLGDPFEDTDKFVLLEDCGHVMEVENMDNLMKGDRETVMIRCCPICRKPIINTGRYKDLVNATFKNEINVIKTRVYGTNMNIKAALNKLKANMGSYLSKYEKELKENKSLNNVFINLKSIVQNQKKVSKLQVDMELVCLNILDMISECYKSYTTSKATAQLNTEVMEQIKLLCKIFTFNGQKGRTLCKISEQQQNDVKQEIKRLNAIIQLAKLLSHEAYTPVKKLPAVAAAFKAANEAVFEPAVFKEKETINALKKLQEAVKVSGVVTQQERQLIVQAIGLKAGHWYKCPNGHFYCIGECGGAMQVGKCAECGAAIGGGSHRLLRDNAHAPEMDGSRFAAWSDQYNNMANFDL